MRRKRKPISVLVVDDETFFAEWLAENLRDTPNRYDAHWVNSGERALEFIQQQSVDLVISDIKMAGVSGIELLNQIRARHPGMGVILMTGYALPELPQEAVRRGSSLYLEKPFPMERLESAIEQALEMPVVSSPSSVAEDEEQQSTDHGLRTIDHGPLSLLDALHLFHLSRADKTVLVKTPEVEGLTPHQIGAGLIYYQDGEVIHAVNQDREGEVAFFQIMSWGSNDYEVFSDELSPSRTIFRDFDSLLREALEFAVVKPSTSALELAEPVIEPPQEIQAPPEMMVEAVVEPQPVEPLIESPREIVASEKAATSDQQPATSDQLASDTATQRYGEEESIVASPGLPIATSPESPHPPAPPLAGPVSASPLPPTLSEEQHRSLRELLAASDHLEGGALLSADGDILASTLPQALLTPAVMADASAWFQICHRLSGGLGRGNHRQSFLQGNLGNIIICELRIFNQSEMFLLFVTNAKATLGLALLQARQRAQKISQLVQGSDCGSLIPNS